MTDKKTIIVLGATGAQGGGLARAILNDPTSPFKVRAVTRDTGSDKAQELAALGAEVVAADLDDAASLEKAFARRLRRVLRHVLLGPLLPREGVGAGGGHGHRRPSAPDSST